MKLKPFTLQWWLKMQDHYWAFSIAHLSNFHHTGDYEFENHYRKSLHIAQWINKRIVKEFGGVDRNTIIMNALIESKKSLEFIYNNTSVPEKYPDHLTEPLILIDKILKINY